MSDALRGTGNAQEGSVTQVKAATTDERTPVIHSDNYAFAVRRVSDDQASAKGQGSVSRGNAVAVETLPIGGRAPVEAVSPPVEGGRGASACCGF